MTEELVIQYIKGDATKPWGDGNKVIAHICNNVGSWGAGFVLALSKRWKAPESMYRAWSTNKENIPTFLLGNINFVRVSDDIEVCNMIAQDNKKTSVLSMLMKEQTIDYKSLKVCLSRLANDLIDGDRGANNISVHMPRIGCGIAGGKWSEVEPIIIKELIDKCIPVTVYDFN